ncbi:uncharacterized protein LOC123893024 [Trifolium pratense]|uniref:uncharacterized protein LOC123893024 n=1 Tax=Trifolium pratense TaxID=57577 RepID=UPI001E6974BF|nr:uncharacterized protein LOC123893024 [Trifolium pratense]
MSELSFSNTSNKNNEFSSNIFIIFFNLCFSIYSHPLYFSYFLFFSPYILKLLSFLSPLFITTTLLLLVALLTFTPNLVHQKGSSKSTSSDLSESKLCFFLSILQNFLAWFEGDDKDEDIGLLDELEAYLVMFQASIFEVHEPKLEEDFVFEEVDEEFSVEETSEVFSPMEEEKKVNLVEEIENQVEKVEKVEKVVEFTKEEKVIDVKSLVTLFQEYAELENVSCEKEEKEIVKPILDSSKFNKVEESKETLWSMRSGSKVKGNKVRSTKSDEEHVFDEVVKVKVKSQRLDFGSPQSNWEYSTPKGIIGNNEEFSSNNLGSFGSMRVEKEWRRTLACKLFEERHNNGDGSEGMDMLWETYEKDSNKGMKKGKKGKKSEVEYYSEDEVDEEIDDEIGTKLCCLQALKFSTGKMNLGMGRPNLVKFSKALKGIGWLHNVGKNGKKKNH